MICTKKIFLIGVLCLLSIVGFSQKSIKLFQRNDLATWHLYTAKAGHQDPLGVFEFTGNLIHVSGEDFGYLVTEKDFANFHLTLQFKWGEKKYPPRENAKRDAGILYHTTLYNGDKIWPRSLEFQVQEGDCGDFWMTDSTTVMDHDTLTKLDKGSFRLMKFKDAEKPSGRWNKAEVIVKDGTITHLVNGVVVNTAKLGNTTTGKIVIQSEGAELYYKNIELEVLE